MQPKNLPTFFIPANLYLMVFCIGGLLPSVSFSTYFEVPSERGLFKAIGALLLALSFLMLGVSRGIPFYSLRRDIVTCLIGLHFTLTLSAMLWSFQSSIPIFLRSFTSLLILLFLLSASNEDLKKIVRTLIFFGVIISLNAVIEVALGLSSGEKVPIIGLHTSKSIIFEQNVFGIFLYACIILSPRFLPRNKSFFAAILLLPGILTSYYRTVYVLTIFRAGLFKPLFFFGGAALMLYLTPELEILSSVVKGDQVSNLSGRGELWRIGVSSFFYSPFIGSSELSIPIISNLELKRDPAFTTYHNVLIDLAASGGIVAIFFFLGLISLCILPAARSDQLLILFLLAPALSNSFLPFSPNPLGVLTGAALVYLGRLNSQTLWLPEGTRLRNPSKN